MWWRDAFVEKYFGLDLPGAVFFDFLAGAIK